MRDDTTKARARRRFGRWARTYEHDRRSRFNAIPQQRALAALALGPADRFLDVGCGTGAAVRAAAGVVERAVGVDLTPEMIERARQLAAGIERVEFVVGDSERLPFPDESFTAVLCSAAFHHFPNPRQALAEMARILAPAGRFALADGTGDLRVARIADVFLRLFDRSHVRLYRTHELLDLVREAGLDSIAVEHLRDGGYAVVTARRPAP